MRTRNTFWMVGAALAASVVCGLPRASAQGAVGSASADGGTAVASSSDNLAALQALSRGTQALYDQTSKSIVRVRVNENPVTFLTPGMLKDFQDWRKSQDEHRGGRSGGNGGGNGRGSGGSNGPAQNGAGRTGWPGRDGRRNDGIGMRGGRGGPNPAMMRRFMEQRISQLSRTDPDKAASLQAMVYRMDAVRAGITGDVYGVVVDDKGSVVVLSGMLREAQPDSLRVTLSDGKETTAKFVGSDVARGLSIIQLDTPAAAPPVNLESARPAPGALLMCVASNTGAVGWISAPAKVNKRSADGRIPLFGAENRGGTFVFDTQGDLAALGWGQSALPMETLTQDVRWIIANRKDVTPRQLGVKYVRVPGGTLAHPLNRDVVRVEEVSPGSPADKAGLKKDDIVVSIDRRPIMQLPLIQSDLATRTGSVPMGIIRDGKEMTLELPLE